MESMKRSGGEAKNVVYELGAASILYEKRIVISRSWAASSRSWSLSTNPRSASEGEGGRKSWALEEKLPERFREIEICAAEAAR